MSRINRLPLGLLDYLGSKTQGDNPSEFLQEVRPTLNLTPFLLAERLEHKFNRREESVTANSDFFTVPSGQAWLLQGAFYRQNVAFNNNAADLEIFIRNPSAGAELSGNNPDREFILADYPANQLNTVDADSGNRVQVTWSTSTPLLLAADTDIGGRFRNRPNVGDENFTFAIQFYRYLT